MAGKALSISGPGIPAISLLGGVDLLGLLCCVSLYILFGFGQGCAQIDDKWIQTCIFNNLLVLVHIQKVMFSVNWTLNSSPVLTD